MPKILFSGTFCALNKGDAAMELGAYTALRALIPEAEIAIMSPFPEIDRVTYRHIPVLPSSRRKVWTAFVLLGRAMLWRVLKAAGADVRRILARTELENLRDCDLLVDLSGDTLSEDYGVACMVSHLMPICYALLLERPVVLCAQTIGPLKHTRLLARYALNRVSLITVRETLSYEYLGTIGVRRPPLCVTSDVAFLMEPAEASRVDAIFRAEKLPADGRPLVGIVVSRLLGHRFSPRNPGQFTRLVAALVDHLTVRYAVAVVLVSHVLGPGSERDDRVLARDVYRYVENKSLTHVIEGDYRPDELKGVIGRFELVVGLRMHANIAALGMGVPTLAISYSRKSHGIMAMVGQERWVCDIDGLELESLAQQVDELWGQKTCVRAQIEHGMAEIRERAQENAVLIRELLNA